MWFPTCLLVLPAFLLLAVEGMQQSCPKGWFKWKLKCFYVNTTEATFRANFELCRKLKSEMVSIHSENENRHLTTILDNIRYYWFGSQQIGYGLPSYRWLDGSPFDYSNWTTFKGQKEPNCGSSDGCCAINIDHYGWYDDPCDREYRQLCQQHLGHQQTASANSLKSGKLFVEETNYDTLTLMIIGFSVFLFIILLVLICLCLVYVNVRDNTLHLTRCKGRGGSPLVKKDDDY